jgi:hypothetical protein
VVYHFIYEENPMKTYMTQSEANRELAAGQTHDDLHPGRGILTMPTHEDIAKRAYDIYVKGGHKEGQCKQNWHQAEHELLTSAHQQ